MDVYRLKDLSTEDRATILEGESSKVEIQDYNRSLRADELDELRTRLSDQMLEMEKHEDAFVEVKEQHNEAIKPIKKAIKSVLTSLKHRTVNQSGRVYLMPDHEKGMMFSVISDGTVIHARQLKPEEKQLHFSRAV